MITEAARRYDWLVETGARRERCLSLSDGESEELQRQCAVQWDLMTDEERMDREPYEFDPDPDRRINISLHEHFRKDT